MWETGNQYHVFSFWENPTPHELFPCSKILSFFLMLSLLVILRSCIARKSESFELWSWGSPEESLWLCPFYSDYTNDVGQHCAQSLPTIDYSTDKPKCTSKITNMFLDELIHKLRKMWLSHSQFYFIKLRRNRISSERWLHVPSKSFFSKWTFQNWSCKEYEIGKDSLQRYRSLSVIFSPSQQEYWGSYPERRRHQWHINLCSKHYCNWPGNNNCKPWKESDIHYYFSRQSKLSTQAWWRRFCGETETRGGRRWNKGRVKGPKGWNLLGRIYCRQDVW